MAVGNNNMEPELTPSVAPVVTPSEEPETPAETVVETPAVEEPKLYKLPDGREVDAEGLKQEYENLLPEFTRKSQELATLKGSKEVPNIDNLPEWKREGYQPKSYAEIIEIAKGQALEELAQAGEAADKQRAEVSAAVDAQVAALKSKDSKLDEMALFAHANKYGFRDLNLAYENMAEMKTVARVTEERILKGNQKKLDPIATGTGSGSGGQVRYPQAGSATEFLARLKK